jgi:hypothetical protein
VTLPASQRYWEDFGITLLRDVATGEGSSQLTQRFFRFLEQTQKSKVAMAPVFDSVVKELHARAFATEGELLAYQIEQKAVTQAALRVIAESMATDNLARARLSKREGNLTRAIEAKVVGSEKRSRKNGWSYFEHLTSELGWPAPRQKK